MPPTQSTHPPDRSDEHLRLLTIFHYVGAGLAALFFCFPLIHVTLGILLVTSSNALFANTTPPPPAVGWIFIVVGGMFFILGQTLACCILITGRLLAKRRRYTVAIVLAGVECLFMPVGTVLGVLAIVTLMRPEVKARFDAPPGG